MYMFNFCILVIFVLIQSSLGNSIENTGSTNPFNHAHREFEHINATLLRSTNQIKDDKICQAISLQRILGVMMTMLRQDLSETSKTAYLLEALKYLLKNTAANNKEVTDKVDDLLLTLDKYKEPDSVYENSLRTETDKTSPLRILISKPRKRNEKLQFKYDLPNLSNSYCTEALVNIAKIAYQAYESLAENPICNLPGFPDYPTKKNPLSELSDLQSLDNPSLTSPAHPSNPIFEDSKFDHLKDFKNVLALYNPIYLPNRPDELIPNHKVHYEPNRLYGDANQDSNPFIPQSSDAPFNLYPHKPKDFLNRPEELLPNELNDHEAPYKHNILYPGYVDAYKPFSSQNPDALPFNLYHHKPKNILNRPEELLPNELNDQEVPYESNPLNLGYINHGYNPLSPQSQDTLPFDMYHHKPKDILSRPEELLPNELNDQEVHYESNPINSGVDQDYSPFFPQSTEKLPYNLYSHKPHKKSQSPFSENLVSNSFSPNGKIIFPKDPSLISWDKPQSPSTDFRNLDQDLIYPENMANDISLNNPNIPNKYPFNHFGHPVQKNPFTPTYVLPQTRPKTPEPASLVRPYSPNNDNLAELGLELPYDKVRPLLNFEIHNPGNPSANTGYNPDVYDINFDPNFLESDVAPSLNPLNEYEPEPYISRPDDASYDRDDPFSNENDEKPVHSPYDLIPKSNYLDDKDVKVIEFIRDAIDAIEGVIPAIEFDPQTLYVIEKITNMLVIEDKDLETNDYRVIVELYKNITNYIKQLNGYDQIIDRIDLSRVTNSSKLETKKVVELTYLVKRPNPVIYYPYYYVKYRLPYPSFVNAAQNLLKPKQLRMDPNQYEELLARSQVVETSPDLKHYKKHDIMGLIVQSGSLINAKIVGENTTLSDHLDALKDITSDLSAEELLKLNKDASSKLNFLAGNSDSDNLFEPINESSRFKLHENNANSAIKSVALLPQILKPNRMQEIANSETELNSNIHHSTEPSADLTTFDSTKLRNTILRSENAGSPFSDHPNNENLLHSLYQPLSSNLPEREKMSPVAYKLLEETINTSLRGQNKENQNSQADVDKKIYWSTVEGSEQQPTNILNPEFDINTAQSNQRLKQIDNTKDSSAFFNKLYAIDRPKSREDNFTTLFKNKLRSNHLNVIYNGVPVSPENAEQTIHSYGPPANEEISKLVEPFDDQYFQPSDFVNQGSEDYDYQIRLKDQQSVAMNQDTIRISDNGLRLQQITNQHSHSKFKTNPETVPQLNSPEPDTVLVQKQNISASNNLRPNEQAISNQENTPLLTSNKHTYTPESNPNDGPNSIPNQQNNAPWTNKDKGLTIELNYPLENSANPSQENHLQFMSNTQNIDQANPSHQNYLPPVSNSANSVQQNNFEPAAYPRNPVQANPTQQNYLPESNPVNSASHHNFEPSSYPRNPDQTFPIQENYLPPSYPVNSGQQNTPQSQSHQIWINPASGQQVIPSQQSSGHGTLSQQNIGIYSSRPESQQAVSHQQDVYNTKDTQIHSQQNDLTTASNSANLGQQALVSQQNPSTQQIGINTESNQQIIPSQQSYGESTGVYPSNPSVIQQATVSQQNVHDNAMYGQQNNAKRYVFPLPSIIYKRPIIQRYSYPLVAQYSRPVVTNYLG